MKTYKWVIEIEMLESWIKDGVNITEFDALNMVGKEFPMIPLDDIKTRILKSPSEETLKRVQGGTYYDRI